MSWTRIRDQFIPVPDRSVLVTCYRQDSELVGHAFATVWDYENGTEYIMLFVHSFTVD